MAGTLAQQIQDKLTEEQLKLVLFAVDLEVRRYKDLPDGHLPIEIGTLRRVATRLFNVIQRFGNERILMHEWEIILVAVRLELARFDGWPKEHRPRYANVLADVAWDISEWLKESRKALEEKA